MTRNYSRMFIMLLGFFLCLPLLSYQSKNTPPSESYQSYYINKAKKYLVKHEVLYEYFDVHKDGIDMFASPIDKKNKKPEFRIYWDEIDVFNDLIKNFRYEDAFGTYKNKKTNRFDSLIIINSRLAIPKKNSVNPSLPLSGKRIAIDPGHTGNDITMGLIESRFVKMDLGDEKIEFTEGELTFATAYILKEMLEKKGAEVIMTRNSCNTSALGISFSDWYKNKMDGELTSAIGEGRITKEFALWLKQDASEGKVFQKYFQNIDWRERCKIINNFKPDLTLIIHYNADEDNHTWTKPTNKNYNVAFVGGGFVKDELLKMEDRFQFLRQLVSDDLENSIRFSSTVINSFEETLKVPTITKKEETNNIVNFSLPTNKNGVYARNLALTRYVMGTLCYGETLLQDNIKECRSLNKRDFDYPCGKTSSRVNDVAKAYFNGIMKYYNLK